MAGFRSRIAASARRRGSLVLALDLPPAAPASLARGAISHVRRLSPRICAVKLNMHLLLPLGAAQVGRITAAAHDEGLEAIADIKLNDIPSTNAAATAALWDAGFDAVIANPVMGPAALEALAASAHSAGRGLIALCHMSSPEAAVSYELRAGRSALYSRFLGWALRAGADGVVAGATYPEMVRYCARRARGRLDIYSPGVGAQGGDPAEAYSAGTTYVIAGRSVLSARDPAAAAAALSRPARA
ncbi:MAG: orotidine 5'-phosphate decarboxylase [Nitrosopumilus sp.]|nr:orotidine 5'-phosphate decarboxylase [Nitrosopumilus sp.]